MEESTKVCIICHKEKNIHEFSLNGQSKDGSVKYYRGDCKPCQRDIEKAAKRTPLRRFGRLKSRARKKGLIIDITLSQYKSFDEESCHYCGEDFERGSGYGLDRIDSSKGYTMDNLVPCCSDCNWMKGAHTQSSFKEKIIKLAKRFEES